jgi:membrane fusion protein (multidrug efflux system)
MIIQGSFGMSIKRIGWILLLASLAIPAATGQQRWGGDSSALVITQSLGFERTQQRVDAVGYAEAIQSVSLYPAVGDLVQAVNFRPGDRVEAGQVLLRLDDRRQVVALERATIQLADAERTVKRLTTSRQQGAIAQNELDNAITARDLLKVSVQEAQTNLDDRTVIAPFSGVVGISDVQVGDRITAQTLITTLDRREQLYIDFDAPESAVELLRNDARLTVRPWNQQAAAYEAEILEVDSRVNMTRRTIRVRASIDNQDDLFRPGMSFRVSLDIQGDSYAVVPEAALMWGAEGAFVWIAKNDKAQRVEVEIQQRLPGRVLVGGALQLGDQLIVEGVQSLRPGQNLRYVTNEAVQ